MHGLNGQRTLFRNYKDMETVQGLNEQELELGTRATEQELERQRPLFKNYKDIL
jgi:hypothetical protein